MKCGACRQALHELAKQEVPPDRIEALQGAVDAHVASCADCRDFLDLAGSLSCRELIDFLNDYVDGALPVPRRDLFDRHLGICEDCRRYLDSYRRTMEASVAALSPAGLALAPPPEDLVRAILAAQEDVDDD